MVRFKVELCVTSLATYSCFNSKMVRFKGLDSTIMDGYHFSFNSKMVRFKVSVGLVALLLAAIVSIPKWYDLKGVLVINNAVLFYVSIPKWYDLK